MNVFANLALQLIVVTTADWNTSQGTLYLFEKTSETCWKLISPSKPITVGHKGVAWGLGLIDTKQELGPHKKEADHKAPAGIFALGPAFGAPCYRSVAPRMSFLPITDDLEFIDDPQSTLYNQFVYTKTTDCIDWNSSENMQKMGSVYDLGIEVQHNKNPIEKGKGSAIFIHVWRQAHHPTEGCTAMDLKDLEEITMWLDPDKFPCLVQLPLEEYEKKQQSWHLPSLPR